MGILFGTNGVRGVVNHDFTVDLVTKLAASIGYYFGGKIAIGIDGRTSSPMFRDAAISGLLSVGCRVYDVGILPTPALQFAVKSNNLSAGIMITASHNPPEFNGIKVIASDGVEVSRSQENEIEKIFFGNSLKFSSWDKVGTVKRLETIESYCDAILSHIDVDTIRKSDLKVAIDPGNGVAAFTSPRIAQALASEVYTINVELDGTFPNRTSEPKPDNLKGLQNLVLASGADLGIAYDGDGDRAIFVDELGKVHWGDRSFALLAREFIAKNPGEQVASPVNSSKVLEEVVTQAGGSIRWTQVGSVVVSRTMVDEGILFGGEENGGIMYGPQLQVRDGSIALVLILEVMAQTGKPLSQLFEELPQYSQDKDKVSCPNELKKGVLEELKKKVSAYQVETIDGIKILYEDGSWVLFRPSGTEPIFRIYAEAHDSERVNTIVNEQKLLIESVVESLKQNSNLS